MPEKSFAERARELQANQEATAQKQQNAEKVAADRRRRLETEGPAAAQLLATEAITEIKKQVAAAGAELFRLPESPQLGAPLEIIIKGKWLLTGYPSGSDFTVGTRELVWMNNPRASQQQRENVEYIVYQIDLDQQGHWIWKEGHGRTAQGGAYMPQLHTIMGLNNAELVEEILSKTLSIAERSTTDRSSSGSFFAV